MFDPSFRKAMPMILLVIPFLLLIFADPFGEPAQTIIEILYLGVIVGITILDQIKSWRDADEVQVEGAKFSLSAGTLIGLVSAFLLVVVVTNVQGTSQFIAGMADLPVNGLPQAAIGFVLGTLTTMVLVILGTYISHATWIWRMARR